MSIRHTGEQEGLHREQKVIDAPTNTGECDGIIIPNYDNNEQHLSEVIPGRWKLYEGKTQHKVFPHVEAIFTDVDGVLTDGGFYYDEDGLKMKRFCTRDAAAVHRLRAKGYLVFAVTHSDDKITTTRLEDMKFDKYVTGVESKKESIEAICAEFELIMFRQAVYIEDDVGGISAMRSVAVSFCPADAAPSVLEQGRVCHAKGGEGVLAEVADLILRE